MEGGGLDEARRVESMVGFCTFCCVLGSSSLESEGTFVGREDGGDERDGSGRARFRKVGSAGLGRLGVKETHKCGPGGSLKLAFSVRGTGVMAPSRLDRLNADRQTSALWAAVSVGGGNGGGSWEYLGWLLGDEMERGR